MKNKRELIIRTLFLIIGFLISFIIVSWKFRSNLATQAVNNRIPECVAFRCPQYFSFSVDNDPKADESEVIVPTTMSDGAGKLLILKNGKIIFESPEFAEISVLPAYNGDGFVISYATDIPPTKYSEFRYKYQNGKFIKTNEPPIPNSLDANLELIKKMGYTVYENYNTILNESGPFMALVGMCTGSADGYCNKVFFIYNGKYLGTDSAEASINVGVKWTSGDIIALEYTLYRKNDSYSSPTGGEAIVRFQRVGDKVVALDPIPPTDTTKDFYR